MKEFQLPANLAVDEKASYDHKDPLLSEKMVTFKYFIHRHLRYVYDNERGRYYVLRGYELGNRCSTIHRMKEGLGTGEHQRLLLHYGKCAIDVPVKPYYALFVEEMLHPFYIFQVCMSACMYTCTCI